MSPTCDVDALSSPTGDTCDGPWEFDYAAYCTDPAVCGYTTTCESFASCPSWNYGITYTDRVETPATQYTYTVTERCSGPGWGNCSTTTSGTVPGTRCNAVATARKNATIASVPTTAGYYGAWFHSFAVSGAPTNMSETTSQSGGQPGRPVIFTTTTRFNCQLNVTADPSPMIAQLPECGCAAYVPATCACEYGTMHTPGGDDVPYPTDADAGPGRVVASQASCTTCDSLDPIGNASAVLSCLSSGALFDGPNKPEIIEARAARIKLLLQLAGDHLTAQERATAEDAYANLSYTSPTCQENYQVPSGCVPTLSTPAGMAIWGWIQLCKDMTLPHVPVEVAELELATCAATLSEIAALPANACRTSILDGATEIYTELVDKTTRGFDPAANLPLQVRASLVALDQWYDAVSPVADRAWVAKRGSELARTIVARAHAATSPLPTSVTSDAAALAVLDDANVAGLTTDWDILQAAFDPSNPIDSPPLLYVVADVLRGTSERLERVGPVHDVACRFAGCDPTTNGGDARTTPFSSALRAMASLDDGPALASVLGGASALAGQHPELVAALDAIADEHGSLATAWQRAGGGAIASLADPDAVAPIEGVELAAMVRAARTQVDSYLASGRVDQTPPRLSAAVLKQEQLVSFLDSGVQTIEGAKNAFVAARQATVNNLIEQTQTSGQVGALAVRVVALRDQSLDIVDQIAGLQDRERSERDTFARLMQSFEEVIGSGALDADAAFQTDVQPPFDVGPATVTFQEGATFSIPAHRSAVVTLSPGETLQIDMTDATWTPACALSSALIPGPEGQTVPVAVAGAITGPEGYLANWTGSGFVAGGLSHGRSNTRSTSVSFEACLGASVTAGGATLTAAAGLTGSVKACATLASTSATVDESHQGQGWESRYGASYAEGVRLSSTPWTTAAAGSLLAFFTPHDHPDAAPLDVRVVGARDSLRVPQLDAALGEQVDVSFVVNDFACGSVPNDFLTLHTTIVTPLGAVAQDIADAMAETIASIERERPAYVAQGGLTAYDAGIIRTGAWARLTQLLAADGHGLQGLPTELKTLFDAAVENEIASLGRLSELDRLGRELHKVTLELKAMNIELRSLGEQSKLLELVPRWHLRDLSGVELDPAMSGLGGMLADYVAPIFELRDPARMTTFRASTAAQLNALLAVDFASPMDEVAADLQLFALSARQSVAAAQFELPTNARRTIALAFPRDPGGCDGGYCGGFRVASIRSSETLWRGITGDDHVGELEVQPADLYALGGGNAQLSCQDLAPVVRRASIYLLNEFSSVDLQALGREVPATAGEGGSRFTFPRVGGVVDFTADTVDGVPLALPVLNGFGGDVLTDFGTSNELGVGAGISPFARFSVDFSSFYNEVPLDFIDGTSAVIVVLEVERQVSTQLGFVPGVCQNTIAP